MTISCTVGPNYEIALPDHICEELNIGLGDILIFKAAENSRRIEVMKHQDQTLSDDEVKRAGNLSRVERICSDV